MAFSWPSCAAVAATRRCFVWKTVLALGDMLGLRLTHHGTLCSVLSRSTQSVALRLVARRMVSYWLEVPEMLDYFHLRGHIALEMDIISAKSGSNSTISIYSIPLQRKYVRARSCDQLGSSGCTSK